jgi:uncharacterized protein (DUF2384 family)
VAEARAVLAARVGVPLPARKIRKTAAARPAFLGAAALEALAVVLVEAAERRADYTGGPAVGGGRRKQHEQYGQQQQQRHRLVCLELASLPLRPPLPNL